ncbi:MAG: pilus assembly protein [Candidatus Dadabacteria bacterium]|nr:MAG: pilus assembly protein [Candidatus Dadabacteria bacterium]
MIQRRSGTCRETGGILIESVLGLLIFFTCLLFGIDLVRVAYNAATLKSAVTRAGRWAELGLAESSDLNSPEPGVNSVLHKINEISGFNISPDNFQICQANLADPDCDSNSRGAAMQWMHIKAGFDMPIFFGTATVPVSASAVIQNEPGFKLKSIGSDSISQLTVYIGGSKHGGDEHSGGGTAGGISIY